MKSVNDIGGENWGAIPLTDEPVPDWALLATALGNILGPRGAKLVTLHEVRRAREDLGPERYHALGYFERSLQGLHDVLVEKDVLTRGEVDARIEALRRP
ncbi:MAG: hypothetical protein WD470_04690 [Rhodospirillaceae bacterium]